MTAVVKISSQQACETLFTSQAQLVDDEVIAWNSRLPVTEITWSDYYNRTLPKNHAPWWAHRQSTDHAFMGYLWVDRALPYFAGHFPDDPILPGVVQLHWALTATSETFPGKDHLQFAGMSQIKFKARIVPGTWLKMDLAAGATSVECVLANANGICTQARLHYRD